MQTVPEFVHKVLKVPPHLKGFVYICKSIQYVIHSDGDPALYHHPLSLPHQPYAPLQKCINTAKEKALSDMSEVTKEKIYGDNPLPKTKEFICLAALEYELECEQWRKEVGVSEEQAKG